MNNLPLKVAVQNINGKKYKEVAPENALLNRLLPIEDTRFPMLRWIDPYSNTIFNGIQMYPLLEELDRLAGEISSEGKQLIEQIRELAVYCRDHPQTYLRFIGD